MQNDFSIKKMKRQAKRKEYKMIRKIRYVWISITIFVVSFLLIALSWIVKSQEWFSNMFLSVGASAITGCVIYFLSNKRLNTTNKIRMEISSLNELKEYVRKGIYYSLYSLAMNTVANKVDESKLFSDVMHEICEASNKLSDCVFAELGFDLDNPFDRDKIEYYIDLFRTEGKKKATSEAANSFLPFYEKIKELILEKERQLAFASHSVL